MRDLVDPPVIPRPAALALSAVALSASVVAAGCTGADGSGAGASTPGGAAAERSERAPETSSAAHAALARIVTCDEAFSVRRAAAGTAPAPDRAGAVRFVGIGDARRRANLTGPAGARDYWIFKAPFEVTLSPGHRVSITTRAGRIAIGRETTGGALEPWGRLRRRVIVDPCPARVGGGRHIAAFPGGLALRRPGCIDVTVRRGVRPPGRRAFPLGVPSC